MPIPPQSSHAKIMESTVSWSSSFVDSSPGLFLITRVSIFALPLFCPFSVQAPVPQEGGVKAEVFSDIWPLLPLTASGLSGSLFFILLNQDLFVHCVFPTPPPPPPLRE